MPPVLSGGGPITRNPRSVRTGGGCWNLVFCLGLLCSDPRRCVGYYAYYDAYYLYTDRNDARDRGGGSYSTGVVVKMEHGRRSFTMGR